MQRQRDEKDEVAWGDLEGDLEGDWSKADVGQPGGEGREKQETEGGSSHSLTRGLDSVLWNERLSKNPC